MSAQSVAPDPTKPVTPDAIGAPVAPIPILAAFATSAVKSAQSAVVNSSFPSFAASAGLS